MFIVKCSSHRARNRLFAALGKMQGMWHVGLTQGSHYGNYLVNEEQLPIARSVKGVVLASRNPDEWLPCH